MSQFVSKIPAPLRAPALGVRMKPKAILYAIFSCILITLVAVTLWASLQQPAWEWTGLTQSPNHAWTIATLTDAYGGFLTFYTWVFYKERAAGRLLWFVLIMTLGNIAMAAFMLREIHRLPAGAPVSDLLKRTAPP
jgi:hypothetical protein